MTWQDGSGHGRGCVSYVEKNIHSLSPSRKKNSPEGERRFRDRETVKVNRVLLTQYLWIRCWCMLIKSVLGFYRVVKIYFRFQIELGIFFDLRFSSRFVIFCISNRFFVVWEFYRMVLIDIGFEIELGLTSGLIYVPWRVINNFTVRDWFVNRLRVRDSRNHLC